MQGYDNSPGGGMPGVVLTLALLCALLTFLLGLALGSGVIF